MGDGGNGGAGLVNDFDMLCSHLHKTPRTKDPASSGLVFVAPPCARLGLAVQEKGLGFGASGLGFRVWGFSLHSLTATMKPSVS